MVAVGSIMKILRVVRQKELLLAGTAMYLFLLHRAAQMYLA